MRLKPLYMKAQNKIALLFFFAAICCLDSCTKEGDKIADCRIVTTSTVYTGGTLLNSITYDNEGRISTINTSGSAVRSKVFNYIGNTIIINSTTGTGSSAYTSM